MIKKIKIKNFILIEDINLELSKGLNIITGETGSGKSMLIDALIVLFGGRASVDFVRNGENKAIIEAEIANFNPVIENYLTNNDIDLFENLIIRREISSKGQSRNFINDTPVNLNLLKELGNLLIDFHGQHEHQSLLNPDNHLKLLDNIADYKDLIAEYEIIFNNLKSKVNELNSTLRNEKEVNQKLDYQKFVLDEINKIKPEPEEDIQIEKELKILENSELIFTLTNDIYEMLYGGENSAFNQLNASLIRLNRLNEFEGNIEDFIREIESSQIAAKEIAKQIKANADDIEFNPEKIENLRSRLYQLKGLQKKYGTLNEILEKKAKIESDLKLSLSFEDVINDLKIEIAELQSELGKIARKISESRKIFADDLALQISSNLENMGIAFSQFYTDFKRNSKGEKNQYEVAAKIDDHYYEAFANGVDIAEFYLSTNRGETPKPLSNVASGGEISRVMLSLKKITSEMDIIDTMVFDEIDTGISGRIAQMVGLVMKEIAQKKQILAITHLPQIAALGDLNISIEKIERKGRETTISKALTDDEKRTEIAKMLSGNQISSHALQSADELINYRQMG